MRKGNKFIGALILTLLLVLTMTGCSPKATTDSTETTLDSQVVSTEQFSRELVVAVSDELEGTDTQSISKSNFTLWIID